MKLSRKVLYNRARPMDFQYPLKNKRLADDMVQLMRLSGGIGLAAPQCGISRRVFVMEIQGWLRQCFNPEIVHASEDSVVLEEGCLSFPGETCTIVRPRWIDVRYQDHQGHWHSERFEGLFARCYQHELDHLEGITMHKRDKEQHAE